MRHMTLDDVIRHYGNGAAAAIALGLNRTALYHWKAGIPMSAQCVIEVLSNRNLVADRELVLGVIGAKRLWSSRTNGGKE